MSDSPISHDVLIFGHGVAGLWLPAETNALGIAVGSFLRTRQTPHCPATVSIAFLKQNV